MISIFGNALRNSKISDEAETAVADALNLEAPAKVRAARYAKLRRIGAKVVRPAGAVAFVLVVVLAIEAAKAGGLSKAQTHWAVFPAALIAIWIAFPMECAKVFAALGKALRAVATFFSRNGAAIQIVGRVAFWSALVALTAYCGLCTLELTKWLPDEDRGFIKLLKPDVRHAFFACFVIVLAYRVILAGFADFLSDFGWYIGGWCFANLAVGWLSLRAFDAAFNEAPPDFESIPMMLATSGCLLAAMLVLAANHEFFRTCVAWPPTSPTVTQPLPQTSEANPVLVPVRAPRDHVLT